MLNETYIVKINVDNLEKVVEIPGKRFTIVDDHRAVLVLDALDLPGWYVCKLLKSERWWNVLRKAEKVLPHREGENETDTQLWARVKTLFGL